MTRDVAGAGGDSASARQLSDPADPEAGARAHIAAALEAFFQSCAYQDQPDPARSPGNFRDEPKR